MGATLHYSHLICLDYSHMVWPLGNFGSLRLVGTMNWFDKILICFLMMGFRNLMITPH